METIDKMIQAGVFKTRLDELADIALDVSGHKADYTDMDLSSAMIIFAEVFMSKMHDFNAPTKTREEMLEIATKAGTALRETVQLFTGVDLHKVYD